jgi:hypothetical protein
MISFSGKWMELEVMMLSKTSQSWKKQISHVFYHMWNLGGEKDMKVKGGLLGMEEGEGEMQRSGRIRK